MKKILAVILLLASFGALAGQVKVDWIAPTEREDNTPLTQAEIGGYRVFDTNGDVLLIDTNTNLVTSIVVDLPNGNTYTLGVKTYDTEGRVSKYSTFVSVALDHAAPKSPTQVTATVLP